MAAVADDETAPTPKPPKTKPPLSKLSVLPSRTNGLTGTLPKITPEIAETVARYQATGLPLYLALHKIHGLFTVEHWHKSLNQPKGGAYLRGVYQKTLADLIAQSCEEIHGTTRKDLPVGTCWALERAFPKDFAQNRSGPTVNVHVQTLVGIQDDVIKRASGFIKRSERNVGDGKYRTKRIEDGRQQVQDVAAVTVSTEKDITKPAA